MFCSKCGSEVANSASFCQKCGAKIGETAQAISSNATAHHAQQNTATQNVVGSKKKRKGWVISVLEKEGCPTISVQCPAKIKQNPALVFVTMNHSIFPSLNVTPKDWKGFFLHLALFLSMGVVAVIAQENLIVGLPLALIDVLFNCIFEINYYFRFIKRKISEGYSVNDPEQRSLCEMAGIFGKR